MHFINIFVPLLVIGLSDLVLSRIPRDRHIQQCHKFLDPTSRNFNQVAVRASLCRGSEKCECSCDDECRIKHSNIQHCCETNGLPRECMDMCTYTTTLEEVGCKASECPLAIWSYCAAGTYDDTIQKQCCRDKGLPEICMGFCDKDGMSKGIALDFGYLACIPYTPVILQCFYDNVPDTPRWKTDDRTFDPEILTDNQTRLAVSLKGPHCAS